MLAKEFEIRPQDATHVARIYDCLRCDVEKEHLILFSAFDAQLPQLAENKSPHLRDVESMYLLYSISTVREGVSSRIMPSQNQYILGE